MDQTGLSILFILTFLLHNSSAQTNPLLEFESLPLCTRSCWIQAVDDAGCLLTDAACACQSATFSSDLACCMQNTMRCPSSDQDGVSSFASSVCQNAGVSGFQLSFNCAATAATTAQATAAAGDPFLSSIVQELSTDLQGLQSAFSFTLPDLAPPTATPLFPFPTPYPNPYVSESPYHPSVPTIAPFSNEPHFSSHPSRAGLSRAAKAIIAVICSLLGTALVALAGWTVRRRRQKAGARAGAGAGAAESGIQPPPDYEHSVAAVNQVEKAEQTTVVTAAMSGAYIPPQPRSMLEADRTEVGRAEVSELPANLEGQRGC